MAPSATIDDRKIRVGIRGASGLLGWRLATYIRRTSDMELSLVIARNDLTLGNVLATLKAEPMAEGLWPSTVYLDEKQRTVAHLNKADHPVRFEPLDQLPLGKHCDILVDATSPGNFNPWSSRYANFRKPVLLQSGEYPNGSPIALPSAIVPTTAGNLYRQGDCVLAGIVPVLHYLEPLGGRLTLHILTQYTDKLGDYPTDLQLAATHVRFDMEGPILAGLHQLLSREIRLLGFTQVPGLSHYTISVQLETDHPIPGASLRGLFDGKPRVRVMPSIRSTLELAQGHREALRAVGKSPKPISVFGPDLASAEPSSMHRFWIALDYKPLVALANIDAIRFLTRGGSPSDAMLVTDRDMGFTGQ